MIPKLFVPSNDKPLQTTPKQKKPIGRKINTKSYDEDQQDVIKANELFLTK